MRATCYQVFEKFFVSDSLVFEAPPSPLIWGRYAAWMGRAAQGLFAFKELLLQIYVDDPIWIARGTPEERRRATVVLLLFWQVFGFPFSWAKGQKGPEVQWIGGTLGEINHGPHGRGVRVEVPREMAYGLP